MKEEGRLVPACKSRRLLASVLLAMVASACATIETGTQPALRQLVDPPSLAPNDRWVLIGSMGTRYEIVYEGHRNGTLVFRYTRNPDDPKGSSTFEVLSTSDLATISSRVLQGPSGEAFECRPHCGELDFPLFVGKSWRHSYSYVESSRPQDDRVVEATIKSLERIAVPAGVFPAFRIESTSKTPAGLTHHRTYWCAPAAKRVIKYEEHFSGGPFTVRREEMNLAEYQLNR